MGRLFDLHGAANTEMHRILTTSTQPISCGMEHRNAAFPRISADIYSFRVADSPTIPRSLQPQDDDMKELTAIEAAHQIAAGQLSSETFVRSCLERVEQLEAGVHAWEHLDADRTIAQARLADRATVRGPLHGVPLAIKDVIDTVDMPTTYGSRIYRGHRPANDATCVALARAAGAIILGKTVTTEFATGTPGKTRNPHNPAHTPGGSSSGSAAAVGCGMVPWAFGTQTYGSTIRPASFCGVVGYKPTYGKADVTGIKTLAAGLDTLGLFARSVPDIALLASVVTGGRVAADLASETPRIGFLDTSSWGTPDATTGQLLIDTVRRLDEAGARVRDLSSPPGMASWLEIQDGLFSWQALQAFAWERLFRRGELQPKTRSMFEQYEQAATAESYETALERAQEARAGCANLFTDCDVLLVPAAAGEAPEGLESTGDVRFNGAWSMLQLPCVTVPMGRGAAGLPIGVQLVGPRGEDAKLLRASHFVEACLASTRLTFKSTPR
ncbi:MULTISPECIES: amidase [Bradyrhizobium]|uniref:amidase n=1 Tax=Bradyrhizobium centrosematis TaxID=1300039 RepID=UPI0021693F7E|nr:amidase [Bradyrhizobium centrosematis]MCS3765884.1 amidase [Bradyrhizobium centrosematis]MCS3778214.1 amidase [Bradyrhizobium centrosematis]